MVILTVAAVVTYSNIFNPKKHDDHHHKAASHKEHHAPEPAAPPPAKSSHSEEKPCCDEAKCNEKKEEEKPCCDEAKCKEEKKECKEDCKKEEGKSEEKQHHDNEKPSTSGSGSGATEIPDHVPYLMIGGGTASYYAAIAVRGKEAEAKVLIIGDEPSVPYNRPPLSKELWWYADQKSRDTLEYINVSGKRRDIFLESDGWFVPTGEISKASHGGVSLLKNHRVKRVDTKSKKVHLDDGRTIRYDKLLIATGGRPRKLKELQNADGLVRKKIVYLRDVIKGSGNLPNILPKELSELAKFELESNGVKIHSNAKIQGAESGKDGRAILKVDGEDLESDAIVVAIGIEPNVELAKDAGLKIDPENGGILADSELQAAEDVYVAGDVASYEDSRLGRRRAEHWNHAEITGRLAGANMTGTKTKFWYQGMFFTKLASKLHVSAVGQTDSKLDTVAVCSKESEKQGGAKKCVVFYKEKDGKVLVGVLMLNMFGPAIDVARRLIDDKVKVTSPTELAKLFPLYEAETPEKEDQKKEEK
ncbi:hypothetical protein WR25_16986 isoform B [Diploscapter pachys]|uniref:FAD/NAD(P)-binding domain-containing protein n=1 Tax=Diploscapter pachys TaxID=2018661 RepID=A0A2A2JKF3_9BILA|nr:hypothetical protein WR25_16986 isoform A [Diploscapter pachys]PAV62184.1 hypothetical protein WR25_16986 isoform B [Diploscapter pachys]